MSSIHEAETWFVGAGLLPDEPTPDVAQLGRLIGMQLDALGVKLMTLSAPMGGWLRQYGLMFRGGECDQLLREALADPVRREALLQGDMQVLWNTTGAARALGTKEVGDAFAAFVDANWKKEWPDGKFHITEKGEAAAPDGWVPPDIARFFVP